MIISRKRFQEELRKREEEVACKVQENMWAEERERMRNREMAELERRLIEVEKKCGIDHPSHHANERVVW